MGVETLPSPVTSTIQNGGRDAGTPTEDQKRNSSQRRTTPSALLRDAGHAMTWVGCTMVGIFAIYIVSEAWPPALLQPEWQQKVTQRILGTAGHSALLGSFLLVSAPLTDPANDKLRRRERLIRSLACAAAIGFALLIPLQITSGVRILNAEQRKQASTMNQIKRASQAIQSSTTFPELRQAYALIPGDKPRFPDQLGDLSLEETRDRIVDRIETNSKQIETTLNNNISRRWQTFWFKYIIRNGLTSILLFVGFASMARLPGSKSSLLQNLFLNKRPRHSGRKQPKTSIFAKLRPMRSGTAKTKKAPRLRGRKK